MSRFKLVVFSLILGCMTSAYSTALRRDENGKLIIPKTVIDPNKKIQRVLPGMNPAGKLQLYKPGQLEEMRSSDVKNIDKDVKTSE